MTLVLKRRKFKPLTLTGKETLSYEGAILSESNHSLPISEHQLTWSEGHPWPKGRGIQDTGGPFETIRTHYNANYNLMASFKFGWPSSIERKYEGNFLAFPTGTPILYQDATEDQIRSFVPSLGDPIIGGMGATAISNVAPTNPVLDGSVAIGELLREGLPSLVGSQLFGKRTGGIGNGLGSEYLNIQFGILPIVSDIKKAAQAVMTTETIIKQLLRDSGKNVRRRYDFPTTVDIQSNTYSPYVMPWPTLTDYHWTNSGVAPTNHYRTERSIWFEGCFTYYLSPESLMGLEGAAKQARLIFGIELTPDTVWNLLPWSWLIDWVVNAGPVMENLGLFSHDGLTLRYGYTMEKTMVTSTTSFPGLQSNGWDSLPKNPTVKVTGVRKIRRKQSPFVLGLTGSEFTLRRAAILTALGMTKG